ncbi:MAG: arginine--tRNA ligase, partial [Clostridiales bacterium]
ASAFNYFYHENHINVDDKEVKKARLCLTMMTRDLIKKSLWLIGVNAPKKM